MKISEKIKDLTERVQKLAFPGKGDKRFVSLCVVIDKFCGKFTLCFDTWEQSFSPNATFLGVYKDFTVYHESLVGALKCLEEEVVFWEKEE